MNDAIGRFELKAQAQFGARCHRVVVCRVYLAVAGGCSQSRSAVRRSGRRLRSSSSQPMGHI